MVLNMFGYKTKLLKKQLIEANKQIKILIKTREVFNLNNANEKIERAKRIKECNALEICWICGEPLIRKKNYKKYKIYTRI